MQTTHPVPPTDANYIQCDSLWYSAALCFSKIVPENSQDSQLWESNGDFVSPLTRGFCFSTEVFFFLLVMAICFSSNSKMCSLWWQFHGLIQKLHWISGIRANSSIFFQPYFCTPTRVKFQPQKQAKTAVKWHSRISKSITVLVVKRKACRLKRTNLNFFLNRVYWLNCHFLCACLLTVLLFFLVRVYWLKCSLKKM